MTSLNPQADEEELVLREQVKCGEVVCALAQKCWHNPDAANKLKVVLGLILIFVPAGIIAAAANIPFGSAFWITVWVETDVAILLYLGVEERHARACEFRWALRAGLVIFAADLVAVPIAIVKFMPASAFADWRFVCVSFMADVVIGGILIGIAFLTAWAVERCKHAYAKQKQLLEGVRSTETQIAQVPLAGGVGVLPDVA